MKLNQKKNFSGKISTKESWYIFFLIIAGISIAFLLVLYFNNPYIPPEIENAGNVSLGTDVTLSVTDTGAQTKAVSLSGKVLPGVRYEQKAFLSLSPQSQPCSARAKVYLYDNSGQKINLVCQFTDDWTQNPDGYYYYNAPITPGLVVKLLKSVQTPDSNARIYSGNTYQIFITVETLPVSASAVWQVYSSGALRQAPALYPSF